MELLSTINLLALALLVLVVSKIYEAFRILIWRPLMISRRFKKQGISGPNYKFLYGNLHEIQTIKKEVNLSVLDWNSSDIFSYVHPHFHQWISKYGETFVYWLGTEPRIYISDPELAKQILSNKLGFFVKPNTKHRVIDLFPHRSIVIRSNTHEV